MTQLELEARVREVARELGCSFEQAVRFVVHAARARRRRETRTAVVDGQRLAEVDPTTRAGPGRWQRVAKRHTRSCGGRCHGFACWRD